jgi:hypothetical protein
MAMHGTASEELRTTNRLTFDKDARQMTNRLTEKLAGGDRRSIGRSNEVVADVLRNPSLFDLLFDGMLDNDPIVRMRAADATEKITAERPALLQPYKKELLRKIAWLEQQEIRWHVAQMLPRLTLTKTERAATEAILSTYLEDKSSIVRTFAMQALAELAEDDPRFKRKVVCWLEQLTRTGTAAMKSRGRKLLTRLGGPDTT